MRLERIEFESTPWLLEVVVDDDDILTFLEIS
jgi:hypothetical protein